MSEMHERAEEQRDGAEVDPQKSERTFRALFDFLPDAIIAINRAGRIVQVNARTETLFGYSESELIGQPIQILVPERYRSAHPQHRTGATASMLAFGPWESDSASTRCGKTAANFPWTSCLAQLNLNQARPSALYEISRKENNLRKLSNAPRKKSTGRRTET